MFANSPNVESAVEPMGMGRTQPVAADGGWAMISSEFLGLICLVWVLSGCGFRASPDSQDLFESTWQQVLQRDLSQVGVARQQLLRDAAFAPHSRLLDAAACVVRGDHQTALQRLQPWSKEAQLRWRFQLVSAQALYGLGRFVEAEPLLVDVLKQHPKHPVALRWLGMTYYDLGAMDHAVGPLEELAVLEPEDYRPLRLLGIILHDFEKYPAAAEKFQEALRRHPPQQIAEEIQEELANAYLADRQYQSAVDVLLASSAGSPKRSRLLARSYFGLGQLDEARRWAETASQQDVADPELIQLLADLSIADGERAKALEILRNGVNQFPFHPPLRYQYSVVLRLEGRIDAADEQLTIWKRDDQRQKRIVELNHAAIFRTNDQQIRRELAELHRETGQIDLAEMWQRAANALQPLSSPSVLPGSPPSEGPLPASLGR
jgi:predicted Zn-dependent protease